MTIENADDIVFTAARALQQACREADGTEPFSEAVVLRWHPDAPDADETHLVVRSGDTIVGYALLDPVGTAELAVTPGARRQGYGRALLAAVRTAAEGGPLNIWSHGDLEAARAFATTSGFVTVRELLQLRRRLDSEPDALALPEGIALRAFRPGEDDESWVALNARAFAHHPEQGRLTVGDLRTRMAEPWFDADGFLVATDEAGDLVGYHWTKVHPEGVGEVYVLGVDPARHGGGLGKALTAAGLRFLFAHGLRTVMLYVEADNGPALAVYTKLGFTRYHADVMYAPESLGV